MNTLFPSRGEPMHMAIILAVVKHLGDTGRRIGALDETDPVIPA